MEELQKLAQRKKFNLQAALADGVSEDALRRYLERLPDDTEKRSLLKRGYDAIFSAERTLGKAAGAALFANSDEQANIDRVNELGTQTQSALINRIKELQAEGKDASRLIKVLEENQGKTAVDAFQVNPGLNITNRQVVGAGIGVAADIASVGAFGRHAAGAKTGKLLTKGARKAAATAVAANTGKQAFRQGFTRGAVQGGAIGATAGLGSSLQQNNSTADALGDAARGGFIGGVVGGVAEGLATRSDFLRPIKAKAKQEKAVASFQKGLNSTKEKFKQKGEKIIPDLLDEEWWGTRKQLLRRAEKNLALSSKQYEQLGELKGMVEAGHLLDDIGDEIAKLTVGNDHAKIAVQRHIKSAQQVIDSGVDLAPNGGVSALLKQAKQNIVLGLQQTGDDAASTAVSKLDDAAFNNIDEFSRAVNSAVNSTGRASFVNRQKVKTLQNLYDDVLSLTSYNDDIARGPVAYAQDLRELAQGYGDELFETRKSLKTVADDKTLSQVKKVDSAIRRLLNTKYPEYEAINKVYHLNSELMEIINETVRRDSGKSGLRLIDTIFGGSGGAVGAGIGSAAGGPVGGTVGGIVGAVTTGSVASILRSSWWNTLRAVQQNRVAEKLLQMPAFQRSQMLLLLQRKGADALTDLGIEDNTNPEAN